MLAGLAQGGRLGGPFLINAGRGGLQVADDILAALDAGTLKGATLDVFEVEPLPSSSPLWEHPHVLVSPHTAALSDREEERIARRFAEDATRLLDGAPMRAVVDTVEFY